MEESRSGGEGAKPRDGVNVLPGLADRSFLGEQVRLARLLRRALVGNLLGIAVLFTGYFLLAQNNHPLLAMGSLLLATLAFARAIRHGALLQGNAWLGRRFRGAMPYFLMHLQESLESPPEGAGQLLMRSYPSVVPGGRWSALQWMEGERVVAAVARRVSTPLDPLLPVILGERGSDVLVDVAALGEEVARLEHALPREPRWEKRAVRGVAFAEKLLGALDESPGNVARNTPIADTGKKSHNGE